MADNAIWHTEFGSEDPEATTAFLGKVFGMQFETSPGMMGMPYHMAYKEGQPSVGVRQAMEQEGGPSQTPFVMVDDVSATLEEVEANGGTVMLPKTAIPGSGWMAWIQVPGGPYVACMEMDPEAG